MNNDCSTIYQFNTATYISILINYDIQNCDLVIWTTVVPLNHPQTNKLCTEVHKFGNFTFHLRATNFIGTPKEIIETEMDSRETDL